MSSEYLMDKLCFACGADNPHGLKLDIKEKDDGVEADIQLPSWTQGYHNTVHGGIISTVLDEMTVWAAYKKANLKCVTGGLDIRIRTSMYTGQKYLAKAKVSLIKHRLVVAHAQIEDTTGKIIAQARAKLIRIGSTAHT
jgi:uncharacterized protein (TIGR00369 family)